MPQIMKANLPHTVLLQNQRKMLCEISGLHKFTDLVDIDITGVFFAITREITFFMRSSSYLVFGVFADFFLPQLQSTYS